MKRSKRIPKPPFFEIGPKAYLYGDELLFLAKAADEASALYGVDVIFTAPFLELRRICRKTKRLFVFAPHMDPILPGRGAADILPEAVAEAGACGVMLNHCEKPLPLNVLRKTLLRAGELNLASMVCGGGREEAACLALLRPDILVVEEEDRIGEKREGWGDDKEIYKEIKQLSPDTLILRGAGISCGEDVYQVIRAGADGTGSSSAVAKAKDKRAMVFEMVEAARRGWEDRRRE